MNGGRRKPPVRRPAAERVEPKTNGLLFEGLKAAVVAIVGGVLGYAGGFIMPPTALYDSWFRQDPNKFAGIWTGQVGGWISTLTLNDDPGPNRPLSGELVMTIGKTKHVIKVSGNHDSDVSLTGAWDDNSFIKIGLRRRLGDRFTADAGFLMLEQRDPKNPAVTICTNNALDSTDTKECPAFFGGGAFFSHEAQEIK